MWIIFLLSLIAMALPSNAIHKRMTNEEKAFHFGTPDDNNIPEYNVVMVHFLNKRDTDETNVKLESFGKAIDVILQPSESALVSDKTPMWEMKNGDSGPIYTKSDNIWDQVSAQLYEDSSSSSSVLIREDEVDGENRKKRSILSGVLMDHGLAITLLPERFQNEFINNYVDNSNDEMITDDSDKNSQYHIVYKISEKQKDPSYLENIKKPKPQYNYNHYNASLVPDTLYIETLFVLDEYFCNTFQNDKSKILAYSIPFWNSVNYMYKNFEDPKIRLTFAGIIFNIDEESLTYISDHRLGEGIDMATLLTDAGGFWYKQEDTFPFDTYDYVITVSSLPLCMSETDCSYGGYAGVGTMCIIGGGWVLSSFTFTNRLGYDDIINAAHEMGHSFGLNHDEDYGCNDHDGIMSATKPENRIAAKWSECSLDRFDYILHHYNYTCLYNKPDNLGTPIPRYLPKEFSDAEDKL